MKKIKKKLKYFKLSIDIYQHTFNRAKMMAKEKFISGVLCNCAIICK